MRSTRGFLGFAGALTLLVATTACAADESAEPWIVTGLSLVIEGDNLDLRADFTAPGGHTGEWRFSLPSPGGVSENPLYQCWRSARIAEPLPGCLRSSSAPE